MIDARPTLPTRGFTLLEIVVVVAILTVMAVVTVGHFQGVRKDTELQQCQANIILLNQAMEKFKANNLFYPTSLDELLNTDAYGMPALPRCPSATSPTNPAITYGMKVPRTGQEGYQYILYCTDSRHSHKVGAGFPQYDSRANEFSPKDLRRE